jgi:hypothetical protein
MKWSDIVSEAVMLEATTEYRGTSVYQLNTRRQFVGLLRRFRLLRGFIDGTSGDVYVWDAAQAVHPEIARMFSAMASMVCRCNSAPTVSRFGRTACTMMMYG